MVRRPRLRAASGGQGRVADEAELRHRIARGRADVRAILAQPASRSRRERLALVKRQVEEAKTALRKARRQDRKLRAERDNEAWEAFHRTADRCYYCGEVLTEGVGEGQRAPPTMRTRDHLIPRSRGGPTHPLNLVHACAGCNARKANRTLEEYRHALVSRGHGGVFWGEEREARKAA